VIYKTHEKYTENTKKEENTGTEHYINNNEIMKKQKQWLKI
jgi:hypothetical protein